MFFNSKVKYLTKPLFESYPSKVSVMKLVKIDPPTVSNSSAVPFLKAIWKYQTETVNMQEQIDSQKSSLITPEYVLKSGEVLDTTNVQYNKLNTASLNAADKIQLSKDLANMYVHNQAVDLANADIKKMQQQQSKQQKIVATTNADKIKQLQLQIDLLKNSNEKMKGTDK